MMLLVSGVSLITANFSFAKNSTALPQGVSAEEIDGMTHQVEYHYGSPMYQSWQEMLKAKEINFYPEDRVAVFPNPSLGLGSQIIIKRANQIVVNDAGTQKTYRSWAKDIKGFLAENNIAIGESDMVSPSKDKALASLTGNERNVVAREGRENSSPVIAEIKITRVSNTEIKEQEEIGYKTITKEDGSLDKGIIKKEQAGKKGIKEFTYQVRRENNKEVEKKLIKSEVTREAQNEIVVKGTKVVVYGTGTATWYDWIGGMTAASNSLPSGTMVHVVCLENGKSVDVKIVDHGIQGNAIIDLSDEAFSKLAPLGKGTIKVRVEKP
ncbi:MAG: G5 domain-containing protein [Patescibacteria group bacterium]|nr:G5 domain-containing protein [Patescibacteria group bacterium]